MTMVRLLWRLVRLPFVIESTAAEQKRLKEQRQQRATTPAEPAPADDSFPHFEEAARR
jgi:hypothetical protein